MNRIDHTGHDHPATASARAACRRAIIRNRPVHFCAGSATCNATCTPNAEESAIRNLYPEANNPMPDDARTETIKSMGANNRALNDSARARRLEINGVARAIRRNKGRF